MLLAAEPEPSARAGRGRAPRGASRLLSPRQSHAPDGHERLELVAPSSSAVPGRHDRVTARSAHAPRRRAPRRPRRRVTHSIPIRTAPSSFEHFAVSAVHVGRRTSTPCAARRARASTAGRSPSAARSGASRGTPSGSSGAATPTGRRAARTPRRATSGSRSPRSRSACRRPRPPSRGDAVRERALDEARAERLERLLERLRLIARRSPSASPALKPASAIATLSTCSWKTIAPNVSPSGSSSSGWSYVGVNVGSSRRSSRAPTYGCTAPPRSAPGRTSATCTVRSSRFSGRVRRRICICARLSIWNVPTVSAALDLVVDLLVLEVDAREVDRLAVHARDLAHALLDGARASPARGGRS